MARNNDYEHTLSIYKHNANNKWAEVIKIEIDQQHEYDTYNNVDTGTPPKNYKKIRAHLVLDVKYDSRHKARLVCDGLLTDVPLSSVH